MMSKVALITGATGGIGSAIALALASAGFNVALHYRSQKEKAEALKTRCLKENIQADIFHADLSSADDVKTLIERVTQSLGPIEVLVNNAGMTKDQLFMRMSEADFWQVVHTNLGSVYHLSKAVIRSMLKNESGRIINISSVVATLGNPGQVNYVSSKAAIEGFTRALAKEIAKKGITVNAVAPGFIETEMTSSLPDDIKTHYFNQIPMQRFGTPEDVAEVVVFLATKGTYMTGQTLHVNGGMIG
jgi:3-oxoacyl-[acyl-carrier protein] reductase